MAKKWAGANIQESLLMSDNILLDFLGSLGALAVQFCSSFDQSVVSRSVFT